MAEQIEPNKNSQENGKPIAVLLIGRSGSGKGTQAKLLIEYMEKKGYPDILYSYTGNKIRELIKEENKTYSAELSRQVMKAGLRHPAFIAVWAWSDNFIKNMKKGVSVIMDGSPRGLLEAEAIDEALGFYGINEIKPVFIDTGREWATKRLLGRGRSDDTEKVITERLDYFDKMVLPVVENYEKNGRIIRINGEQSIEGVHKEMVEKIFDIK
ncbi:MAG: Adenylate kinase [Parcubacteria group bacterium GW2011_GWB2_40_8]|nr:MAG: Adenylate kinase [Parcubacteria group bacterium GW2011_GWB2_40_8]